MPLVSGVLADDVVVANGVFTVVVDFGLDVFNGDERWLGVSVRPGAETGDVTPLLPRHRLTAAPYALLAKRATTADVAAKANDVAWASIKSIPAGPGIAVGAGNQLAVSYAGNGVATTAARSDHDHFGQGWVGALGSPGLLVQNTAANGIGLLGRNDVGTGFTPAAGTGVLGDSSADAGVTGFSATGTGVLGRVFNGTANNDGVRGENASTSGRGTSGYATAATGVAIGVWGQSDSTGGVGVRGFASATAGTTYGGYFSTLAPNGVALYATADKSGVANFNIGNRGSGANALEVRTDGLGLAAKFTSGASTNKVPAVQVAHLGDGDGLVATAGGAGNAGNFKLLTDSGDNATGFGSARALQATSAGTAIVASADGGTALSIEAGAIRVKGAGVNTGTAVFIHECTADNTPIAGGGNTITFINHPLCNGNPNAILFVTPRMANDTLNVLSTYENLAIFYSTSVKKWALMNTSVVDEIGDFDVGNRFNVMVIVP